MKFSIIALLSALVLSACGPMTAKVEQSLRNGDTFEVVTSRPSAEEEVTMASVYGPNNELKARQVSFDDALGGDIARAAVPGVAVATTNGVAGLAISHEKGKHQERAAAIAAAGGGATTNYNINVEGSQAASNAGAYSESLATVEMGPCGLPVGQCQTLGSMD